MLIRLHGARAKGENERREETLVSRYLAGILEAAKEDHEQPVQTYAAQEGQAAERNRSHQNVQCWSAPIHAGAWKGDSRGFAAGL